MEYYNYYNLQDYLSKNLIKGGDQYIRWVKNIIDIKTSMFSYDNLPEGLTSEIIETALMFNNFLCFYNHPTLGVVLCRYLYGGDFDIYWKPIRVNLLSLSGKPIAYGVPYQDIILCRDNRMDIIPFVTLSGWIDKIMEMENTMGILVKLVRFPTIMSGTKEQVQTLKNVLKKNADCEGFLVADKGFKDHLEQFNINLPCMPNDMEELMEKYEHKAYESMGIYDPEEKKERLISNEVNSTNDYTDFVYEDMLYQRQQFVNEVNERYGTSIVLRESYVENMEQEYELEKKAPQNANDSKEGEKDNGNQSR